MELLKVQSVQTVRQKLQDCVSGWELDTQYVNIDKSLGRVLSEDIIAHEDIPGFSRSTVDGYALRGGDTNAAGENIPVLLELIGSVEMGEAADVKISAGQCAEIATGAMLPRGADGVVMVEYTESFSETLIGVHQSVASGENVVQQGEDIRQNMRILGRGQKIRAQEIGVLAASGVSRVPVFGALRLAVISTGDELVPTDAVPSPGQVRDINTHALAALAQKSGFEVVYTATIRDDETLLENELCEATEICDIAVVSGGSSQGKKDATRKVIDKISTPGVFTHGMAIKPGKPTIIGFDSASRTILSGLPGHPVSAMMVFEILFGWLLRDMMGAPEPIAVPAKLSVNLASSPGKSTYWPVKLITCDDGYLAQPSFGKSGLITTLTSADGYISVSRNTEGISADSLVYVTLF